MRRVNEREMLLASDWLIFGAKLNLELMIGRKSKSLIIKHLIQHGLHRGDALGREGSFAARTAAQRCLPYFAGACAEVLPSCLEKLEFSPCEKPRSPTFVETMEFLNLMLLTLFCN